MKVLTLEGVGANYNGNFSEAKLGLQVAGGKEIRAIRQTAPNTGFSGIRDVSLSIGQGEFFGILGESGSGKTTLARVITGQHPCLEGQIYFRGKELTKLRRKERLKTMDQGIQMVFQDPYNSFNPYYNIGFQMMEPLIIAGERDAEKRRKRAEKMLHDIGLSTDYLECYPRELSGGQLQRIAIGCALITEPALLVADEPVSALDVSVQAQILDLFAELRKKLNFSCLFISHDVHVIYYLCDKVGVMAEGELVEQGPVETVYCHPEHEVTKTLVGRVGLMQEG